jgi:hypothetical protein
MSWTHDDHHHGRLIAPVMMIVGGLAIYGERRGA